MISVIVPAFNSEKTIGACIQSILGQKCGESFELIVVDDGSKDSTSKKAKEFRKARLVVQKNKGPASARNLGAAKAKGRIILFVDSDCIAEKDWLKEMTAPFKDWRVAGVQGTYKSRQKAVVARYEQLRIMQRHEKMKEQESVDFIGSFSAAFRRKEFIKAGGFDEKYKMASGEDTDLSFRLSEKGHKLVFAPKAVVWHTHPESLWKYLKVKFWRAFWRVPLYSRHKGKIAKDSYTSWVIKTQMGLALLGIASLVLVLALFAFANILVLPLIAFIIIPVFNAGFFVWACGKDLEAALASFPINFLESFALAFGLAWGMAKKLSGGLA